MKPNVPDISKTFTFNLYKNSQRLLSRNNRELKTKVKTMIYRFNKPRIYVYCFVKIQIKTLDESINISVFLNSIFKQMHYVIMHAKYVISV